MNPKPNPNPNPNPNASRQGVARVLVFSGFCVLLLFEWIGMAMVQQLQQTQLVQLRVTDSVHKVRVSIGVRFGVGSS